MDSRIKQAGFFIHYVGSTAMIRSLEGKSHDSATSIPPFSFAAEHRHLQADLGGQGVCPSATRKTFTISGGRPQDLRNAWQCALETPGLVTIMVEGMYHCWHHLCNFVGYFRLRQTLFLLLPCSVPCFVPSFEHSFLSCLFSILRSFFSLSSFVLFLFQPS